jgi:hypothetical protein
MDPGADAAALPAHWTARLPAPLLTNPSEAGKLLRATDGYQAGASTAIR